MSKIYLAGRYRDRERFREARDRLERDEHVVVARWLDDLEPRGPDPTWHEGYAVKCAARDIADILCCNMFVLDLTSLTGPEAGENRGGLYVELGLALAVLVAGGDIAFVLIGAPTNIFTYSARFRRYDTLDEFVQDMQ